MKKVLINLKDWFNLTENAEFSKSIDGLPVVVFPSLPYLYLYKDNIGNEKGIQDISRSGIGPHTGCVSFEHLKDFNISFAIINHREKKVSDDDTLKGKIKAALTNNINATICFDGLQELKKIGSLLAEQHLHDNVYLAYEPFEEKELLEIKKDIVAYKKYISDIIPNKVYLIYGGNVSKDNIGFYNNVDELDGFLISRHALKPTELKAMLEIVK